MAEPHLRTIDEWSELGFETLTDANFSTHTISSSCQYTTIADVSISMLTKLT